MAGPWFTVQPSTPETWHPFGELWLSNGALDGKARIEIKLWLDEPAPTTDTAPTDPEDPR